MNHTELLKKEFNSGFKTDLRAHLFILDLTGEETYLVHQFHRDGSLFKYRCRCLTELSFGLRVDKQDEFNQTPRISWTVVRIFDETGILPSIRSNRFSISNLVTAVPDSSSVLKERAEPKAKGSSECPRLVESSIRIFAYQEDQVNSLFQILLTLLHIQRQQVNQRPERVLKET